MKRIFGLDLGTTSIGWAVVNEAENDQEQSSIVKVGVRVNPLSVDEIGNFEKGKAITTNSDRTLKRQMRRNLSRYKLRRDELIKILINNHFITAVSVLSEQGSASTFATYRLRAKAATEQITLEEFARVLLMINKKRGYKSNRKTGSQDEGKLLDGMAIARQLYESNQTPGEFMYERLQDGKQLLPDFYRSDLLAELRRIWDFQKTFYPDLLTDEFEKTLEGLSRNQTAKSFLETYGIYTLSVSKNEKLMQEYEWRRKALYERLPEDRLATVICDVNAAISNVSNYLGMIGDRSKIAHLNKRTVGQILMDQLAKDPHTRLKGQVFYRQDYLDEFEQLWEVQAQYHPELTPELKETIRDVVIFYQRRLKSQKGLVSFCEFESKQVTMKVNGKDKTVTWGSRVCPKSSPLFQEFRIWQVLNNVVVFGKGNKRKAKKKSSEAMMDDLFGAITVRPLKEEEKEVLYKELAIRSELTKDEALKLLFENHKELDMNFKKLEGNRTQARLFEVYQKIIELTGHQKYDFAKDRAEKTLSTVTEIFQGLGYKTDMLTFDPTKELDGQPMFQLWHLLYSYEEDKSVTGNESLLNKLSQLCGFEKEYASLLAQTVFESDYASLSAKAIRKILTHLRAGLIYDQACEKAGYRHSKSSLTKTELDNKVLKDRLELLPKNSLRNPVVEKILNQMVNVINALIDEYGKPDEVRVELARELKKSADQREEMTKAIGKATKEHEAIRELLKRDFGLMHVSRNDIIRYKLYEELKDNGYRTLYSSTYIAPNKLFSREFDIEHIIPQSRLFDDSFANKTLEKREVNEKKANDTAFDFVLKEYGEEELANYIDRIEALYKGKDGKKTKLMNLMRSGDNLPEDFINRDINETQYIARKAKEMLEELVRTVVSTSGKITDKLRQDWQLVDVMQELNWAKYDALGMTEVLEGREGQRIYRIKDWNKRNDHRHHAMDALTVAFTKQSYIQYLNNLNARKDQAANPALNIQGIIQKHLERKNGKWIFKPPFELEQFRQEARKHLGNTLISIKAKNKVVTPNVNKYKKKGGVGKKIELTPRGQLHNETIYGSIKRYVTKEEKVGSGFDAQRIALVTKKFYREALLKRLEEHGHDPKKAFTGKNSLEKNPIWLDEAQTVQVPERVQLVWLEQVFTIRKEVTPDLKLDKVIDVNVRRILQNRLDEYGGNSIKAFSNLDKNPIWLNKEKGISIKRVTITGINNGEALHIKKDKCGNPMLDEAGNKQPVDYVSTSNNHHVAFYRDETGKIQDEVVTFFDATLRANSHLPIVDKEYKRSEGWQFLFTMKQNEYFVFPNEKTGFDPLEIDLQDPENYARISPNLYRVQTISRVTYGNNVVRDYKFRHHLETMLNDSKALQNITYKQFKSLAFVDSCVKVRVNHIGQIVSVGEY